MPIKRYISSLMLGGALLGTMGLSGCGGNVAVVGVRYRDPYHNDYHRWDDGEVRYYNRWVIETHRPSGREYRRLRREEQREYWNWRHSH